MNNLNYDILQRGLFSASVYAEGTKPLGTFIQRLLFGATPITSDHDFVEYDYSKKAGIKIPEEALRGADPNRVNAGVAFDAKLIRSLYYYVADKVSLSEAEVRRPGEALDKPLTFEQRMLGCLVDKKKYHVAAIDAAKEKMCVDALLTGQYTVKNGGLQKFPIASANLAVAGANLFTKPLEVINAAKKIIRKNNGVAEMMIWNPDDWANFLQSAKIIELFDTKQINLDDQHSEAYDDGSEFVGKLRISGIGTFEIWTYGAVIDGTEVWAKGKVYMGPKQVGAIAYCGVPVNAGGSFVHTQAGVEVSTTTYADKPQSLQSDAVFEIASAPAALPIKLDQWAIITSVPASLA